MHATSLPVTAGACVGSPAHRFLFAGESTVDPVDAALAVRGLARSQFAWETLRVPGGTTVSLPTHSAIPVPGVAHLLTADLAQYKRWIGFSDDSVRGRGLRRCALPCLSPRRLQRKHLGPEEIRELNRACEHYLFGDSREVAAYRAAIERHLGPFGATVLVARHVEVERGGALEISGQPTVLIAERMVIHEGGRCDLYTVGHLILGTLVKPGVRC